MPAGGLAISRCSESTSFACSATVSVCTPIAMRAWSGLMGLLSVVRKTCWYSSTGGQDNASRLMFITSVRDSGGKRRRSHRNRVCVSAGLPLGAADGDVDAVGSGVGAAPPDAVGDAAVEAAGDATGVAASWATIRATVLAFGDERTDVGEAPVAEADADAVGEADGDGDADGDGGDDVGKPCGDGPLGVFEPEAIT